MAPRKKATAPAPVFDLPKAVDEYGDVCDQLSKLEKRKDELRKELLRHVNATAEGERYCLMVVKGERESLDTKKMKEEMPQSIIEAYTRKSETTTVNVRKK